MTTTYSLESAKKRGQLALKIYRSLVPLLRVTQEEKDGVFGIAQCGEQMRFAIGAANAFYNEASKDKSEFVEEAAEIYANTIVGMRYGSSDLGQNNLKPFGIPQCTRQARFALEAAKKICHGLVDSGLVHPY